jgi:hypothetical protein
MNFLQGANAGTLECNDVSVIQRLYVAMHPAVHSREKHPYKIERHLSAGQVDVTTKTHINS